MPVHIVTQLAALGGKVAAESIDLRTPTQARHNPSTQVLVSECMLRMCVKTTFFGITNKHGRLAARSAHARPVENSPVIRTQ